MTKNKSNACAEVCGVFVIDPKKVKGDRRRLPRSSRLEKLTSAFKAMAHPGRLAILHILSRQECCVCEITEILEMPVSTVSQHLRVLKTAKLVKSRQQGKLVHYSLAQPGLSDIVASWGELAAGSKRTAGGK
ncbi:MAG: ArsR/SmtB family transcription factor [Planctomycetota bacterium]